RRVAGPDARRGRLDGPAARGRGPAPRLRRHGRRGDAQPGLARLRSPGGRSAVPGQAWPGRLDRRSWRADLRTRRARRARRPTQVEGGLADRRAEADQEPSTGGAAPPPPPQRGKTVHGEPANAGHRVLAPDDAEVEAYFHAARN